MELPSYFTPEELANLRTPPQPIDPEADKPAPAAPTPPVPNPADEWDEDEPTTPPEPVAAPPAPAANPLDEWDEDEPTTAAEPAPTPPATNPADEWDEDEPEQASVADSLDEKDAILAEEEPVAAPPVDESPILGQPDTAIPDEDYSDPPQPEISAEKVASVLARSTCISLTLRKPGNTARLGKDSIQVDSDERMVRANKILLDSEELKAITKLDSEMRAELRTYCIPVSWLSGKAYLIPIANIETVEKMLRRYETKRQDLINTFLRVYPLQVEEAKAKLRTNFDPNDYPDVRQLRREFDMTWQYIQIGTPDEGTIGKEIYEMERRKMDSQWKNAAQEVQDALRFAAQQYVSKLVEALSPGEDGKKKIFKDTTVTNLTEFLDGFKNRNLTNDTETEVLVEQARAILKGVDPAKLRKDEGLRAAIAGELSKVGETLKSMTVDKPARRIDI